MATWPVSAFARRCEELPFYQATSAPVGEPNRVRELQVIGVERKRIGTVDSLDRLAFEHRIRRHVDGC